MQLISVRHCYLISKSTAVSYRHSSNCPAPQGLFFALLLLVKSSNMHREEYEKQKKSSSQILVNKWLLFGGIVVACLAIVGVGLGVYFGTKVDCTSNETTTPSGPTTSGPIATTIAPNIRLPTNLMPLEYVLTIRAYIPSTNVPNFTDPNKMFTFDGNVTIEFTCVQPTTTIVLQMNQINISDYTLTASDGSWMALESFTYDPITQFLTFPLKSGTFEASSNYTLNITYTGSLNDDLVGFYRSSYMENGQTKWLAVTQFEPTDARRALPCFDEPAMKAVFTVTLIHPSDMTALSNAMENGTTEFEEPNWSVTTFISTPKMSTYLFAMCIAQFEHLQQYSQNQILFRVWARPSMVAQAWYAVEMGPKVLDTYTKYFNISFPLEKQDMLAIPDLAFGGMENWGMITYRERDILLNNQTYAATNVQRTATVIAHELAHMWFGDLVTLAWWDDLWLNEGFAEFFEYFGADVISDKSFNMTDQFVPLEISLTMQLDQLTSSHPIYDPSLVTPDQINAAFDDISYDKGACIIRMLHKTVGEEVFRQGLNLYLTSHEYSNANHSDLWSAIQTIVDQTGSPPGWNSPTVNVADLMNPWTLQMNFPVVTVQRDYTSNTATLSQSRFILPSNATGNPVYEHPADNFTWYIPVWYNQDGLASTDIVWLEPYKTSSLSKLDSSKMLIVNSGVYVLYRTMYDMKNWNMIQNALINNYESIDVRNRAQIVDDGLNLARAGILDYNTALNLTLYLNQEMNYIPWSSIASSLSYFQDMFALTEYDQVYGVKAKDQKYLKTKVQPVYQALGWDDSKEGVNDVLVHELRQFAISTMCKLEDKDCTSQATNLFTSSLLAPCQLSKIGTAACSKVANNIRKPVYCTGISQGDADDFNFLFQEYPLEQDSVERDNILYGLCCTKSPWAINKLLNEAVNPSSSFIRQQDVEYIFEYLGVNDVGRVLLWPFFANNWDQLASLFASGFLGIAQIIQAATRSFNTANDVQIMQNFLNAHNDLGSGLPAFMQQMELAEANVQWMQSYAQLVIQWFQQNTPSS